MKHLYFLFALVLMFFSDTALAQNNSSKGNQEKYNMPPGYQMPIKMKIFDLSHKLNGKHVSESYTQEDLRFLKNIPENEIEKYKMITPEYYQYYITGRAFINSLSPKVKSVYTDAELWYIYAFDQKLKTKLTIIK
jgi:hypothetical protein